MRAAEKSISLLKQTAHCRRWMIASNLCDGCVAFAQSPRNVRLGVFRPQSLTKPLSIRIAHHSFHLRVSSCCNVYRRSSARKAGVAFKGERHKPSYRSVTPFDGPASTCAQLSR
jgi:hypothetical protein